MKFNTQRHLGAKAAQSSKAKRTLAAIMDKNICYADILKTAADEAGIDALVKHVLKNDPELAFQTLLNIPNLGSHRTDLIKKVAESPKWALKTLRFVPDLREHSDLIIQRAGELAQPIGEISGFNLIDQAWYNCQFTMFWVNNGKIQPQSTIPKSDWGKWKWSSELHGGGSGETRPCTYFVLPKTMLEQGNEVWLYMWVRAGDDIESSFRFTYNPNTADIAYFSATGTTKSTRLSLSSVSASPQ